MSFASYPPEKQQLTKGKIMNKSMPDQHDPNMLNEYDFSKGVRGKYAERYYASRNLVRLDEKSANDALQDLKWAGRNARGHNDYFKDIRNVIPIFDRQPFRTGDVENQHLDTIIKLPTNLHDATVPIATVSKSYSLVQHHEVLDAVERAFNDLNYDTEKAECNLHLTEYGERMWLKMRLPEVQRFDPGDGHPLTLQFHALNSVDRSTPLTFEFGWYRLICSNGLMRLNTGNKFRKRHTTSLAPEKLVEYLSKTIVETESEAEIYKRWQQQPVKINTDPRMVEDWVDATVTNKWGILLAARTYNILRTATDGKVNRNDVKDPDKRKTPHKIRVVPELKVPGAHPVENVYDVANTLSWLASHQPTLQTRYKHMTEVPELLKKLTKVLK